jgi:Flp pilus assembly protein TadB
MTGTAVGYGIAVGAAAWLMAQAAATGRTERVRDRLGAARRPSRGTAVRLRPPQWLSDLATERGWSRGPWSFAGVLFGSAVLGAALGWNLAGPVGGVAGAAGIPLAVQAILARRVAAHRGQFEEHLKDIILALASGVRAGLSVRRAIEEAGRDAGPPLDRVLQEVGNRLSVGEPLEVALGGMADRLDLPDISLVVTVLAVHRRTGGDLSAMLEEVADVVADRIRSRREVRALTAQGRASGAVLAVLPVAFVALLSGTGGEALGAFYRSPLGAGLLVAGLVCEVIGFLWIRRIVTRAEAAP